MNVLALSHSNGIAARISKYLDIPLIRAQRKKFPDGEIYVRIPQALDDTTIIVQSLEYPQSENFIELLECIEAARGLNTQRIITIIPYLAYARQDKRFLEGEPITVKIILKTLESLGVDALITVDIHQERSLKEWLSIPARNVLPYKEIASYFKNKLESPLVLAPDKGALKRAKLVAEQLNTDFDYNEKKRDRITGEVTVLPRKINVENRDIIIVDDIISTGGTITLATKSALENGANRVYVACTHALLINGALDRIFSAGATEVVATDTVKSPISKISVAPTLANALKEFI